MVISSNSPTGSGSAATARTSRAMPAIRSGVSVIRSRNASVSPWSRARSSSGPLTASSSFAEPSIASAIRSSPASFSSVDAVPRRRDASRTRAARTTASACTIAVIPRSVAPTRPACPTNGGHPPTGPNTIIGDLVAFALYALNSEL